MNINFYDLEATLWDTHSKEVVIDKNEPAKVILRLSGNESFKTKSLNKEFKLEINYNGETRYLDPIVWKNIKKISPSTTLDSVGISRREFTEEEFINKQKSQLTLFKSVLSSIKGTNTKIGIITGRTNQKEHEQLIDKLKEIVLKEFGVEISKTYFVNDKNSSDSDGTAYRKVKILLEYMVGFKIKRNTFTELKQTKFDKVEFFDDNDKNIDAALNVNTLFLKIFNNSTETIRNSIIGAMENKDMTLLVNKITNNKLNPYVSKSINLEYPYSKM